LGVRSPLGLSLHLAMVSSACWLSECQAFTETPSALGGMAGARGKEICATGKVAVLAARGRVGEMRFQGGRVPGEKQFVRGTPCLPVQGVEYCRVGRVQWTSSERSDERRETQWNSLKNWSGTTAIRRGRRSSASWSCAGRTGVRSCLVQSVSSK
jgi:hypothetical protein